MVVIVVEVGSSAATLTGCTSIARISIRTVSTKCRAATTYGIVTTNVATTDAIAANSVAPTEYSNSPRTSGALCYLGSL